jgi:thiamine biosynthesis lipoprotein
VGDEPSPLGEPEISLRRFVLPGLFVLALFVTLWMRRPEPPPPLPAQWELGGDIFGTTWAVKIIPDESGQAAEALRSSIEAVLDSVDAQMSTYKADSELSRLNAEARAGEAVISAELADLIETSRRIHALSEGAFDITIGPLVNAWGFGPNEAVAPSPEEQTAAAARVGMDQVKVSSDDRGHRLLRARDDIYIDLSAVAKGYAVDLVAESIEAGGHSRFLVEIGGEIRAQGRNQESVPWSVGIETPDGGPQDTARVVALSGNALATSGNYRNLRVVDGRSVTHILDPRNGQPVSHGLGSVSVIHSQCSEADALATALYVLGWDEGFELAEREGIAALFLRRSSEGRTQERATDAFKQVIETASP